MNPLNPSNIRQTVLLLSLATIGPVIGLILFFNLQHHRQTQKLAWEHMGNIAQQIASENTQINEAVRQLLISLSISPQLSSTSSCSKYLKELLTRYQRYANFGVADQNGNLVCAGVETDHGVNLSDRTFFQRTMSTQDFTVGEYFISPITGKSILNYGYPLSSSRGVVYASLDLSWLADAISSFQIEEEAVIVIFDQEGTILARYPDPELWIGKPQGFNVDTLSLSGQIQETSGVDGIDRIYAYQLMGEANAGPYVAVGIAKQAVLGQSNEDFYLSLILSLVGGVFSVGVGLILGRKLVTNLILAASKVEALKKDFVSLVSHQIRTPLTSIKYLGDILLSESPGKLNFKQREFLTDIADSTRHLIGMVGKLLHISRLEVGNINLVPEQISLSKLIRESQRQLRPLLISKKLEFKLTAYPFPKLIKTDPKLVRQVVDNLLSNAIKYCQERSVVECQLEYMKSHVQVSISNQGPTISPSDQLLLFTKFFRAPSTSHSNYDGSGLGLYLCKQIVEIMGGKIWLESKKGKTTFTFTLPCK